MFLVTPENTFIAEDCLPFDGAPGGTFTSSEEPEAIADFDLAGSWTSVGTQTRQVEIVQTGTQAVATFVDDGPFIGEGVVSWVADVNTRVGVGIIGLNPAGTSFGNTSVSLDIIDENNLIINFEGSNSLVTPATRHT